MNEKYPDLVGHPNSPLPGWDDRLLTVDQLADHWQVSRAHVYNLCRIGLPSLKLGAARRFRLNQANAWLADNCSVVTK